MSEAFIHYLWQYQYFERNHLLSTQKEHIEILEIGTHNRQDGADFRQAKVIIDGVQWIGNIEIHVQSADWFTHKHDENENYENVILHVVWQDNAPPIRRKDGSIISTLELRRRVNPLLVERFELLLHSPHSIACASQLSNVKPITIFSMIDFALMQRLERKSSLVLQLLERNGNDWEETTFQWFANSFGFKTNSEPFLQLAQSISLKTLLKHTDQPEQVEALLFGQAGFLEESFKEDYLQTLKREYHFLRHKYKLTPLKKHQWHFLRIRPVSFPTVRLAQFAQFIIRNRQIFSLIINTKDFAELVKIFQFTPSPYWITHYDLEKESKQKLKGLGIDSIHNLIINGVVPLLVCYGKIKDDYSFIDQATLFLENLPSEDNGIIKTCKSVGFEIKNSADSQAFIELHNEFCIKKKCLQCKIGNNILKL